MKVIIKLIALFLFFVISVDFIFSEEILSYFEGKLSFQRPIGVTLWEERPQYTDPNFQYFWRGKIQLIVRVWDTEVLIDHPPTIMSQSVYDLINSRGYLSRNDLLDLFNKSSEFVLSDIIPRSDIRNSYKHLIYDETTIGEAVFVVSTINLEVSNTFGYGIHLIIDNAIVQITLTFSTNEDIFNANETDTFFTIRDNKRYWKDDQSILSFYDVYNSTNYITLPEPLQQLREAYELILQTLKVQHDNNYISSIKAISPPLEFQRTHTTTRDLHLLERGSDNAPTILELSEGTDIQVIMFSRYTRNWAIVATKEGVIGWAYSGYLKEYLHENVIVEDKNIVVEDENTLISEDVKYFINLNNEAIQNNVGDTAIIKSRRIEFMFFFILISFIVILIFLVMKKRR